MKKVLVINTLYKEFGGEDSNINDEVEALKKNFEVKYLEYDNKNKLNLYDLLSFLFRSNISSNQILEDTLNKFNPDYAYVHNVWFKANLGIFKILDKKQVKVLHKLHNYRFECSRYLFKKNHLKSKTICNACGYKKENNLFFNKYYKESYLKSLLLNYFSRKYFKILKNSNYKLLVLSEFQRNYLKNLGFKKNNISIYPNPINLEFKKSNSYKVNSEYIVFAGRLEQTKGIEEVLYSWLNFKPLGLKLKIIGTGFEFERLSQKYNDNSIKFIGSISNENALKEIKNSRAVVTATKLYEGQPRVLLEASSFGVPSIFPNFGGMPEFFPSDYKLSFEQFNYEQLNENISKLNNEDLLIEESLKLSKFISKKFNDKVNNEKFTSILNELDKNE